MLCRPPTAFALFLKSQKGKLKKIQTCEVHKEDGSVSLRLAEVEICVVDAS
jgi:hypothetical protein